MFIGHFALGFGAKRLAPQVSLGTLFLAAQFADLLWPSLVLAGVEWFRLAPHLEGVTPVEFTHYPWSHSLLALAVWGLLFAAAWWIARRGLVAAAVLAVLVVSHWFLDFLMHRPDLPLTIVSQQKFGLGLWNHVPATFAVEFAFFAAGVYIYARTTEARDRTGSLAFWALVLFLAVVEVANLLGPVPPSAGAVA
jgi:hypothetical protein